MSIRAYLPGQVRLILAITLVYVVAWFAYYSQIPAGQYPSEETRETLEAARALAEGIPTKESGHSIYTYTLSILAHFFGDAGSLTFAARGLNALALIFATGFCASAAGHYWLLNRAVFTAGLLIGLNPVLIFWAGEVSPYLLATACMSAALWGILRWLHNTKVPDSIWIAVCLSLAAAFESTLLPLTLLWPIFAFFYPRRERIMHFILALIPITATCGLILVSDLQLQDPLQWNTDQLGLEIYQALGNPGIYETKSFNLYRQLHLFLFLNPIHWGALCIMAFLGAYVRLKDGYRKHSILLAIASLSVFAVSFALNDSSSPARATMMPLLAILAAGVTLLPKIWKHASRRTRSRIVISAILVAAFSYAGHFGHSQPKTWERDYKFLAEANIRTGNNDHAAMWAKEALELNPASVEMQEVIVFSEFNKWAMASIPRTLPIETTRELLEQSRKVRGTPGTLTIAAIYQYKLQEIEEAKNIWESQRDKSVLALLCLYWTENIHAISASELNAYKGSPYYELLAEARQIDRTALTYGNIEKLIDNMLAFAY